MREHVVSGADGAQLRVLEYGKAEGPPVVLVHGLSMNAGVWDSVLPALSDFRVFTPDLRGHGGSDAPENNGYASSATWADDLAAVISLAEQPVLLVAWSYGGLVATDYLRNHGDTNLSGLVLVSPLRKIGSETALALLGPKFLETAGRLTSDDLNEAVSGASAFVDVLRAGEWDVPTRERLLGIVLSVPSRVRAAILARVADGDETIGAVNVPTLVIYGTADEAVMPSSSAELKTLLPTARVSAYPGAGHMPFAEEPTRFQAELAEFANGLPAKATAAVAP
jgi:pimeloyl-ACP methyl ester carboxylesterase